MAHTQRYRYVEHTADVEFIAYGSNLESTFKNAMLAMFNTIAYINLIKKDRSEKPRMFTIRDKAESIDTLLWYALQDVLSISDSRGLFAYGVEKIKIIERPGAFSLVAKIAGKPQKAEHSKLEVKGVSGYNLKVKKSRNGFSASVVVDV